MAQFWGSFEIVRYYMNSICSKFERPWDSLVTEFNALSCGNVKKCVVWSYLLENWKIKKILVLPCKLLGKELPEITEKRMACPFLRCPLFAISFETHFLILYEVIFHEISRCVVVDLSFKKFRFCIIIFDSKSMTQKWRRSCGGGGGTAVVAGGATAVVVGR